MLDLNQLSTMSMYNPLLYTSTSSHKTISYKRRPSGSDSSSSEGSSDTLVDAASMASVSLASSCDTYISQGGDAYKCARSEFVFRKKAKKTRFPFPAEVVPFKSRLVVFREVIHSPVLERFFIHARRWGVYIFSLMVMCFIISSE